MVVVSRQSECLKFGGLLLAAYFYLLFKGIVDGEPVAVKTTKRNADKAYLKALLSELKIMIYLGRNDNIVQIIGASTKDLDKGTLYIFVPFCALGNMENFLRNHREDYSETLYNENLKKDGSGGTTFSFSRYHLLLWAHQIASGMAYLSSKKVIHGDMSGRNVLLTESMQAKITDFGLSRQLYGYESYVKKHQEPLPWRWMAIEALRDLTFSTQSDVWSYGITLWEIFSLGEVPYPGMSWTLDFVDQLQNGLRIGKPRHASKEIYDEIMIECWRKNPSDRITFPEIIQKFAEELDKIKIPTTTTSTSNILENEEINFESNTDLLSQLHIYCNEQPSVLKMGETSV